MTDNDVGPHATTLGTDMDIIGDPDLEVLRAAAAKAQEAAIQYQTQTASLCGTRIISPHSTPTHHRKIYSSPNEMQHTSQMAVSEGVEPVKERDTIANKEGSRDGTIQPSGTIPINRRSSPGDSALGESLSDTEEIVRRPTVTAQPFVVDATTPLVFSTSNNEPNLMSQQQSLGPLLPHEMNTGKPKEPIGSHKGPVKPSLLISLKMPRQKLSLQPSIKRPQSMPAQNVRQSKIDRIRSGSKINQESLSPQIRKFSRSEDLAFIQVFKTLVYKNITVTADRYKKWVSQEELFHIGKSVANEIVTEDFQYWVRENSYNLSKEQQSEVKEFIKTSFSRRVSQVATIDRTSMMQGGSDHDDYDDESVKVKTLPKTTSKRLSLDPFDESVKVKTLPKTTSKRLSLDPFDESVKVKSLPKITSKRLSLDPFDPSSTGTSSRHHTSNDLSFLGPGEISEPAASSQICKVDDLSLLGPGQMSHSLDPVSGFNKPTAQTRPFSKSSSHYQSPGFSPDITLATAHPYLLSSNARIFDSASLGGNENLSSSRSSRSHARRNQVSSERIRTPKSSDRVVSQLDLSGRLENDMNASVPSLDGNSKSHRPSLSRDGLSIRQKQAYGEKAGGQYHLESSDELNSRSLKKNDSKPKGRKIQFRLGNSDNTNSRRLRKSDKKLNPNLQIAVPASRKKSPRSVHDTSSAEDGEEVLATWLSLSSKMTSPRPTAKKVHSVLKDPFNSLYTSNRNSFEGSELTSLGTDLGNVSQGTSFQSSKARELISTHDTSVEANDMTCISKGQHNVTSKSIRAIKEGAPHTISKPKLLHTSLAASRSESLRSRRKMTSSQAQTEALEALIFQGDYATTVDPLLQQTVVALASNHSGLYRPYRSHEFNVVYPSDSHNTLKHVDFYDEECEALLHGVCNLRHQDYNIDASVPVRIRLGKMVQGYSYEQITELINHVHSDTNSLLPNRKKKDIRSFISDLQRGLITGHPAFFRVEVEVVDPANKPQRSLASLLRHRELGSDSKGRRFRNVQSELRLKSSQDILPWRSWKRASGDVVTCAWAPNSQTFAVGAAAPSNYEDLQYNRPHNLMLGDLGSNVIRELPDHRVDRPQPDMIPNGPNSSHDMYNNLDPMIYMTVSSLQFSRDGSQLMTASHDQTARVWDISSSGTATCLHTLYHDDVVTGLDVSPHFSGLFATASKVVENPIRVYSSQSLDGDGSMVSSVKFSSPRAQKWPQWELYPECLRWGKTPNTNHLLLAGFQQWGEASSDFLGREGEICLWDVNKAQNLGVSPSRASVLTATWHPTYDMFAVGGVPVRGSLLSHPHTTRSIIRTWDTRNLKRYAVEYECPALDMQDVTFNPLNPNIVTAGCTDSATYVWDFRWPDQVLLKLQHDKPLMEWDHNRAQEEADAGVMMSLWGLEGSQLYTGSSDGIIKCWDTSRAPEDALVRNVADIGAGVQSGAFSPDFCHLLIGDSDGVVHVLTSAPVDRWHNCTNSDEDMLAVEPIKLIEAEDSNRPKGNEGILAARKLLQTGQLVLNQNYGVGQGPNYSGPYARYARREGTDPAVTDLLPQFDAMQPFSRNGQKRREIARRIEGVICGRKQLIAQAQEAFKCPQTTTIVQHEGRVKKQKALAKSESLRKKRALSSDEEDSIAYKRVKVEIIDLTDLLSDDASPSPSTRLCNGHGSCGNIIQLSPDPDPVVKDNFIPDSELLEEKHCSLRKDEESNKMEVGAQR